MICRRCGLDPIAHANRQPDRELICISWDQITISFHKAQSYIAFCFLEVNSILLYPPRMAPEISQVNFRMPTELKERLERGAKSNKRTLTAEIVARLEDSFRSNADIVMPHVDFAISQTIKKVFEELEKVGALVPSDDGNRLSDLEKVFKDKDGE